MNQLPEQVRSFIAIEIPDEARAALRRIQTHIKPADTGTAKWVDPTSIHLTLKFLGAVKVTRLDSIVAAMEKVVSGSFAFSLSLDGLGAFPNLQRLQVIWIGLAGDIEALQILQEKIETALVPLGFPAEKRSFTPHLTLARIREHASRQELQGLADILANSRLEQGIRFKVGSVNLMRSELARAGAIYSRLASVRLQT